MNKKTFMPKTFMLFVTLLIAGGISTMSLTGCGIVRDVRERVRARQQARAAEREDSEAAEDGASMELPDVVFVDTRAISEWDYLVVTKEEAVMVLNVNEATGIPTLCFLKPQKDLDTSYTLTFKENGLLDAIVYNGFVFYYDNFRDYRFDMTIIAPNGMTDHYYGIETDIDWDAVKLSDDEFTSAALSDSGRTRPAALDTYPYGAGIGVGWNAVAPAMSGRTAPGGGPYLPDWGLGAPAFWDENKDTTRIVWDCVGYAITAGLCIGTFVPILAPFFGPACVANLIGELAEQTINLLDALDVFEETTLAGAGLSKDMAFFILDAVSCGNAKTNPMQAIDCVEAFHGVVSIIIGEDLEVLIHSDDLVVKLEEFYADVNFHNADRFNPPPGPMKVEKGTTITLPRWENAPTPTMADPYTFVGWGTNANDETTIGGNTYTITDNTSLYAKWYKVNANVPTGVTAEAESSSSIMVSWDAKDGAIAYYIYRGLYVNDVSPLSDRVGTAWTPNTTFTDTGLPERRTFFYRVSFTTGPGESWQSDWAYATTPSHVVPKAPSPVNATADSSTSITVEWAEADNAKAYYVYRAESVDGDYTRVATVDAPETHYTDTGLSPSTAYFYKVSSFNYAEGVKSYPVVRRTLEDDSPGSRIDPLWLTENIWADGSVIEDINGYAVWYQFYVERGETYYIWWNDYPDGDFSKTANVEVAAYDNGEMFIFFYEDSGWTMPKSFTAESSGMVKLIVALDWNFPEPGTFAVAYSTTDKRPPIGYTDDDGNYIEPVFGGDGTFTLIGIPSGFNGMYAMLVAYTDDMNEVIEGFESWRGNYNNATLIFPQVNNGQVIIPLWTIKSRGRDMITQASSVPVQYTGNHTFDSLSVVFYKELSITGGHEALMRMDYDMTYNVNGELPLAMFDNVRFSDGRATRTWRDNTISEHIDGGGRLPDGEDLGDISSSLTFGSWPAPGVLAEYGLSGLTAPSGATNISYAAVTSDDMSILSISFQGSQANDSAVARWFTSNGWSESMNFSTGEMSMWYYEKRGFTGMYTRSGTDCTISSIKE